MTYPPDGGEWPEQEWVRPVRGDPRPRGPAGPPPGRPGRRPEPMPDWRDPTDPRGMRATRAPRGRGGGGIPPRIPTIPTVLVALTAVVLAFVIGRASGGGGGGESEVSATPTSVSTTTLAPKIETHTVAQGESLSSIAASYGLTTEELASFNGITNVNHVFVGQKLSIPTAVQPTLATTTTKAKGK